MRRLQSLDNTYLICDPSTIEESCDDVDTSVASGKMMEGDKGGLEFQGRRTLALGNPMSYACQEWLHVWVWPDISSEWNSAHRILWVNKLLSNMISRSSCSPLSPLWGLENNPSRPQWSACRAWYDREYLYHRVLDEEGGEVVRIQDIQRH